MNAPRSQPPLVQWNKVTNIIGHQNALRSSCGLQLRLIAQPAQSKLVCRSGIKAVLSERRCQCVSLTVLVQLQTYAAHSEDCAGSALLIWGASEVRRSSCSISPVISARFAK